MGASHFQDHTLAVSPRSFPENRVVSEGSQAERRTPDMCRLVTRSELLDSGESTENSPGRKPGFLRSSSSNSRHTGFRVTLCQDSWFPRQPHQNPTRFFHFLLPETLLNIPLPFISSPSRRLPRRETSDRLFRVPPAGGSACLRPRPRPGRGEAGVCRWPWCPPGQAQPLRLRCPHWP